MDRHLNIFHAYRQGGFEDADRERVLEDNVTRALIITLRSCDLLTQKFIEEFTGIDAQGPYEHDLQSRLEPGEEDAERRSQLRGKCLIVVAGHPDEPEIVQGSDAEMLGGSRPDAWIRSDRITVLFENKLRGNIEDAQIRRHVRVNFGEGLEPVYPSRRNHAATERNQVPVVLLSWHDVYNFLSRFSDEQLCSQGSESHFIVCRFLEYLEVIGMGPVKFSQDDFLTWERYTNMDEIGMLNERVRLLGEELAGSLEGHRWVQVKRSRGHLGGNVILDSFKRRSTDQMPHWSCGLFQDSKRLSLYIQCESKRLAEKLVKQRECLECNMTDALWESQAYNLPGLTLGVSEKLHIVAGGSGKNAAVWKGFTAFPLELCKSKEDLLHAVRQVFDAMDHLLNSDATKRKVTATKMVNKDVKSVWGVLGLAYGWNWLELENEGTTIADSVKEVAGKLMPCYQVLLDAYSRESTPQGRRQSKQGS